MNLKFLLYGFEIWLLFVVFFIVNGAIRNFVYSPIIGEWKGIVVSSIIGIGFIFCMTYLSLDHLITGYSSMD